MRKRNRQILIRMTEEEYDRLLIKLRVTGQNMQTYIIQSALDHKVTSSDEKEGLIKLNMNLEGIDKQLRDMGEDLKICSNTSDGDAIKRISEDVKELKKEVTDIWRSLRRVISQH